MTMLAAYDSATAALTSALKSTDIGEVKSSIDDLDVIKLRAKQVRDRQLLADATEFQMRVERWLGVLLRRAEEAGQLAGKGRPKALSETVGGLKPATLDEIGVDRKLSMRAKAAADLADNTFDDVIANMRERMAAGKAVTVNPADLSPINGARAMMGSRAEPDNSLDYFPTPPWATRALLEHVFPELGHPDLQAFKVWEPACGEGHIADVLTEYFGEVCATDIFAYGYGLVSDFLTDQLPEAVADGVDWIITNPPFGDTGEEFVHQALDLAEVGIAMFMRVQWLDSIGRYERVFRDKPPTLIAFFAERVNLCKGRWDPEGGTATAYMWLIWKHGVAPHAPFWIPPGCREQLARPDDVERFTTHPVTKRILEAA